MAKTPGTLVDAIGSSNFYSKENGKIPAETKRSAIKQAISTNLVPSAINFGKPVKTIIARNELLMNSIVNNQLKTSLEYPKMFGALESTVRTLSVAAEITARKIHENNREFHEALLAKLTGEKTPTRAAGATKTIPKSRPGKAPARTPLSRGGPPTSIAGRRAAERAQGLPKQRSAEVLARAERFAQIRRTRMARGALIGGAAGIAGGAIAGGLYDAFGKAFGGESQAAAAAQRVAGGGQTPTTPTGTPSTTPSTAQSSVTGPGGTQKSLTEATEAATNAPTKQVAGGLTITTLKTKSGKSFQVNSKYAKNFAGFIADLEATGYQIREIGGYRVSNIAGTNTPSWHGLGVAIDINPAQNPVTNGPAGRKPVTDMPSNINEIANKWGLGWGGAWTGSKQDAMHFSMGEGPGAAFRGNRSAVAAGQDASSYVSGAIAASPTVAAESGITGAATGQPIAGGRNQPGGEIGRPSAGLNAEKEKLIRETAARFGMNPNALTGILNIESGGTFNPATRGGASNRYYGIFQLQDSQIPGLTRTALGQSLTPEQYQQRSFADQLKVYEQYIKNAGVSAGFFTGDASKDASRLWALQLAPGNARRLNYDDPNTVISRSRQAAAISAEPGLVTVGSVQRETLRRGGLEGGVAAAPGAATGEPVAGGRNQPAAPAAAPGAPTAQQPGQQQQSVAGFSMPVDGARLSSGFGQRWGRLHAGLDFAAPTGTPVKAAAPGVVVRATPAGAYGNLVEIRHADGTHTRYAHLSAFNTTQGATVSQGQVIGAVGSTGRSTGPHLHFEIRRNGGSSPVDPRPLLGGAAPTVQGDQAKTSTEPGVVQPSAGSPRTRGTPAAAPSTSGTPMSMPSGLPGNDLFGLSSMFGMMGMGRPGMSGGMLAILPLIMRNNVVVNRKRQASGEVPFNMTSAPINPVAGIAGLFGQVFRGF